MLPSFVEEATPKTASTKPLNEIYALTMPNVRLRLNTGREHWVAHDQRSVGQNCQGKFVGYTWHHDSASVAMYSAT